VTISSKSLYENMTFIKWLGDSPEWITPVPPTDPEYLFALVEESVLSVALSSASSLKRVSPRAAFACTSRLALRVALSGTGLNPSWQPLAWQPGVIKAPASTLNQGVRFMPSNEHIEALAKVNPELAGIGVWEEYISGETWELDGCVIDGHIRFFNPIRQHWNEDNTKILKYEAVLPFDIQGIGAAVRRAVIAIGINNSPFCAELRLTPSRKWKLIEIHCRLGEDKGLAQAMWYCDPLKQIEAWIQGIKSKQVK
jgi:hypothetical protein